MLFDECRISNIFSFSNKKFIFENVDHRFKFCLLSFMKGGETRSFQASFRINPREAIRTDELEVFFHTPSNFVSITTDFIRRQSKDSLSIMEMKDAREFAIVEKMLKYPLLGDDVSGKWKMKLGSEFHMTNDSHLFNLERKPGMLPLYEGKMIHQFTHKFATGKYWVDEAAGRKALLGKELDKDQSLDYQEYRLVHRSIASSTNERTMISLIIPKNVFYGHSLNSSKKGLLKEELLYIISLLNSCCLDYYLRQSVSANLTMFFIYQLPVPRLSAGDRWFWALAGRAAALVCVDDSGAIWPEFAELWQSVEAHGKAFHGRPRMQLRAEIDGIVAHLYGLTEAEFVYILGTFPLVEQAHKVAAQNAWQDVRDGVIVP